MDRDIEKIKYNQFINIMVMNELTNFYDIWIVRMHRRMR